MATFKPCVRKIRTDGFWTVYIRCTHERKTTYMKTDKMVDKKGLDKSGEIKDSLVLLYCLNKIRTYIERLNRETISNWTLKEVVSFLESSNEDVCFSDYAKVFRFNMAKKDMQRTARNYEAACKHIEKYAGTNKLMFSRFTSKFIHDWINELECTTSRAKEMYPGCIKKIFNHAVNEYNDYDRQIIRIKTNPWAKVQIPKSDTPEKKAISINDIRTFFSSELPLTKSKHPLTVLAKDLSMMVMCLAGINTADLYDLKKSNLKGNLIGYNRKKTKKFRADKAYIEIKIPDILMPVVSKYLSEPKDEYLFNFHIRQAEYSFNSNVNTGIRRICKHNGFDDYCIYTFRHSWGTIARNDCKYSLEDVAFSMNHVSAHRITDGYIKTDYSIVSELNQKVVDLIFGKCEVKKSI